MTLITTVAELEALPVGAILCTDEGAAVQKRRAAGFMAIGAHIPFTAAEMQEWAPLTLLWATVAASSPELRSTRCCGHDCQDTALLRPGSTYLCPDHGDCSADIRKEQATNEH